MGVPTTRQASCGLAIVTTVAAVGLSLKTPCVYEAIPHVQLRCFPAKTLCSRP
jgi:hypothetical protein